MGLTKSYTSGENHGSFTTEVVMKHDYDFETDPHVCEKCGGENWHYNAFFLNNRKEWLSDPEITYWCADCSEEISIIPKA